MRIFSSREPRLKKYIYKEFAKIFLDRIVKANKAKKD